MCSTASESAACAEKCLIKKKKKDKLKFWKTGANCISQKGIQLTSAWLFPYLVNYFCYREIFVHNSHYTLLKYEWFHLIKLKVVLLGVLNNLELWNLQDCMCSLKS